MNIQAAGMLSTARAKATTIRAGGPGSGRKAGIGVASKPNHPAYKAGAKLAKFHLQTGRDISQSSSLDQAAHKFAESKPNNHVTWQEHKDQFARGYMDKIGSPMPDKYKEYPMPRVK